MSLISSGAQQPSFQLIYVTPPPAGIADYFTVVPIGQQWEMSTCFVTLTSSSAAGNRNIFLACYDPRGHTIGIAYSTVTQTASGYFEYTMSTTGEVADVNEGSGFVTMGLPTFLLSGGCSVHVKCIGIKPNDQFAELLLGVKVTYPYMV